MTYKYTEEKKLGYKKKKTEGERHSILIQYDIMDYLIDYRAYELVAY